jgi:hypothetical protein
VKEYDIFVPLYYNDGSEVEVEKFQQLQETLLDHFGGLTFFPQPNKGVWRLAGITYRDEIVIYRVIGDASSSSRRFLERLKKQLKTDFQQEDILVVQRDVETL